MRWLNHFRALGNRNALHLDYTNTLKKTSWRLRKCLRDKRRARRACMSQASQRMCETTQRRCERHARHVLRNQRSACAAMVSLTHAFAISCCAHACANRSSHPKTRFADSESCGLATNKFSRAFAFQRIRARPRKNFARNHAELIRTSILYFGASRPFVRPSRRRASTCGAVIAALKIENG